MFMTMQALAPHGSESAAGANDGGLQVAQMMGQPEHRWKYNSKSD